MPVAITKETAIPPAASAASAASAAVAASGGPRNNGAARACRSAVDTFERSGTSRSAGSNDGLTAKGASEMFAVAFIDAYISDHLGESRLLLRDLLWDPREIAKNINEFLSERYPKITRHDVRRIAMKSSLRILLGRD